jgi:hypothetical protein
MMIRSTIPQAVKDNQRASHFKVGFENPSFNGGRPSSAIPVAPQQVVPIPASRVANASALTKAGSSAKEINS